MLPCSRAPAGKTFLSRCQILVNTAADDACKRTTAKN